MDITIDKILWIHFVIFVVVTTEVFAYLWHRFSAHNEHIPYIRESHKIHHETDLNLSHTADEDFIWILILFVLFEIIAGLVIKMNIVPGNFVIVGTITSFVVFLWNWYVHKSFHQKDHWLNNYEWFRIEKERHYIHHFDPTKNYGIGSHFTDIIMNTWHENNILLETI